MIQIRPVSDLRNKFPEVEKLVEGGEPVFLTKNGYGSMVVISMEEYERLTRRVEITSEFESLIGEAKNMLRLNPEADQTVVVRTKSNRIFSFACKMDELSETEDTFVQRLVEANATEIKHVVCMWYEFGIDQPSMHFRKRLLEISAKNGDAQVLLQGADDFHLRTINSLMPA